MPLMTQYLWVCVAKELEMWKFSDPNGRRRAVSAVGRQGKLRGPAAAGRAGMDARRGGDVDRGPGAGASRG